MSYGFGGGQGPWLEDKAIELRQRHGELAGEAGRHRLPRPHMSAAAVAGTLAAIVVGIGALLVGFMALTS